MLGDTLTLPASTTYNVDTSVAKIREDSYSSEYMLRQLTYDLRIAIAHSKEPNTGNDRHVVRLRKEFFPLKEGAVSPNLAAEGRVIRECYLVVRVPPGAPDTEMLEIWKGLAGMLSDDTFKKIVGWQS